MKQIKILIADDEERWRLIVRDFLENEGYAVVEAANGAETIAALRADPEISLVLLDVMMPVMDGVETCREIRAFSRVPVIIITAREDEETELTSFDCGADEFVSKSVKMRPLMARIKALLKRVLPENDVLEVGEISIDLNARTVSVGGRNIELTPKEFELLLYLAQYQNVAKSRQQILHSVWNTDYYGDARTVDTHVKNLRMKLGAAGNRIRTVRGMGYLLGTRE